MRYSEITSPTLIIDKKTVIANIKLMTNKAKQNNLIFRPHFKTHQSLQIGQLFRDCGVEKITVSSIDMAIHFASDNWSDITIAFPVNIREIDKINNLSTHNKINLCIENIESVKFLKNTLLNKVGFFIKIDVGYNRTGISYKNINYIDEILKTCDTIPNLEFKGFLSHFGNTYHSDSIETIHEIYNDGVKNLNKLKEIFIPTYKNIIISIGDTPSCSICNNLTEVDEIRPGNFVYYDFMQYKIGSCTLNQIASILVCPVVSKHSLRNEVVIHGGAIHLSKEYLTINNTRIYGLMVKLTKEGWEFYEQNYYVTGLSQEHGIIKVDDILFNNINIGDLIGIIPIHSCLTQNLMTKNTQII